MPTPSRWMIRCSMIYMLTGFIIGGTMLTGKAFSGFAAPWQLLPVHIELMIFGWIIQFTLGTAYWILPRYLEGAPRGNLLGGKMMVLSLNLGILLDILSYIKLAPEGVRIIGRLLETGAVALFIFLHWNRIVSYRN